ncbi:MAG: ADP-ribosyltransferase [Cellulosilyticaceae bacterium]
MGRDVIGLQEVPDLGPDVIRIGGDIKPQPIQDNIITGPSEEIEEDAKEESKEEVDNTENVENADIKVTSISELSSSEIQALIKYSGDDYVNINNSLRGLETLTETNERTTQELLDALEKASLPNKMTLHRGTSTDALGVLKGELPENLIGKTIVEKGFMSTSMNDAVASETFSGNMQITIQAPIGAKGIDISSVSEYVNEAEVLFQAGTEMVITKAEQIGEVLHITVRIKK